MGFPRPENWSELQFPSLGDLANPCLLHWQVNSLLLSYRVAYICYFIFKMGHRAYLAVQWLRLHLPVQGVVGLTPVQFSSVQLLSRVWLFMTPWTAAHQASLSSTISHSLFKLMSINSVMPSNHLIFCCPFLLLPSIFPSIRVFSSESTLHIRWPKYWSFSFSISPSRDMLEASS